MIVAGILCGSVVARMQMAWPGGFSNVFSSALNAPVVNMCTLSMLYTLYLVSEGEYLTFSLIFLISSTPLLLAASISITSLAEPSVMLMQMSHSLQGSPSGPKRQLRAFANIFAMLVLPVPRGPLNR